MNPRRMVLLVLAVCAGGVVLAEMACRLAGLTDFPVYLADDQIGYIPAPDQSGRFLGKNEWIVNDKSQGTTHWNPVGNADLLLLGDSIVWGGNPLAQPDKLGPNLERRLSGWRVWPASAGSWSMANEIAYLDRFPEVESEADAIVWVVNSGDLQKASQWTSDAAHPRSHPASALAYVFEKYVKPRIALSGRAMPEAEPPPAAVVPGVMSEVEKAVNERLALLKKEKPGVRILFVLVPAKEELPGGPREKEYEAFRSRLAAVIAGQAPLLDVRADPHWNAGFYRDGIHPTAAGDSVLADIIAQKFRKL